MTKLLPFAVVFCFASMLLVGNASAGLLLYEPFDYTAGSAIVPGNVSINSGQGLTDTYAPINTPANTWLEAGSFTTGTVAHQITGTTATVWGATSLTAPSGFPATNGKAAALMGGAVARGDSTEYARMNLPSELGPGSVLYYSALVHVSDLAGLTVAHSNVNAANDGIIILNDAVNAGTARPNVFAGELTMRLGGVANSYNLGVRSTSTAASTTFFEPTNYTTADTLLVVVRYTAGPTMGDGLGVSDIWVNPSSATFGLAAPTPDGSTVGSMSTSTPANDHVDSLIIGAGIAGGTDPNETDIDELRLGTTWADVTAAPTPEPASIGLLVMGAAALCTRRRRA